MLSNLSRPPARQLRSQDLLCCCFFGGPGQGWLGAGGRTLAADGGTPPASVSLAFEPPFPSSVPLEADSRGRSSAGFPGAQLARGDEMDGAGRPKDGEGLA